jgi:hypothetical protein
MPVFTDMADAIRYLTLEFEVLWYVQNWFPILTIYPQSILLNATGSESFLNLRNAHSELLKSEEATKEQED